MSPALPLHISFHDVEQSKPIIDYVRSRAHKLDAGASRIVSCNVAIEAPHRRQRHGRHHRVRIDLAVPGDELMVGRAPADEEGNEDVYAAIDDAFDTAQRLLRDFVGRKRAHRRDATRAKA
jgi:ribosomal subunit interface protein